VHDSRVTVKHATASTFVFVRMSAGWRIGLIMHPLFGRLMIPGGHVEPDESPPEAARREVTEETGLAVSLAMAPGIQLPAAMRGVRLPVQQPWWILEQPVPADNHLAGPHIHLDHLYVALAQGPEPGSVPAHPFSWHSAGELAGLDMFPDTRLLAAALFGDIQRIAATTAAGNRRESAT